MCKRRWRLQRKNAICDLFMWNKASTKLTDLQKDHDMNSMPDEISAAIKEQLLGLGTSLEEYLSNPPPPTIPLPITSNKAWIRNLFTVNKESETELQDSVIDFIVELLCDIHSKTSSSEYH